MVFFAWGGEKSNEEGENMKEGKERRKKKLAVQSRTEQKKNKKILNTQGRYYSKPNPFAIQPISRHKEYTIIDPGTRLFLRFHVLRLNSIDLQMLTAIALAILRSSLDIRL